MDRRKLLLRCDAQIQLTPSVLAMECAQQAARDSVSSKPGGVSLEMFRNPSVVRVHELLDPVKPWNKVK